MQEDASEMFYGDPVKLSQILMNLVHNAMKFSPKGGQVSVEIERKTAVLNMRVKDQGKGLPDNVVGLFEQFAHDQQHGEMHFRGVGLGLHIVKSHVDAMQGRVSGHNAAAGGAEFVVVIPEPDREGRT